MLSMKNVTKDFVIHNQGGIKITPIKDITFEVKRNEIFCLTGQSGTGKSTILKMIYGAYRVTKGNIYLKINGEKYNISDCQIYEILEIRKKYISYISQFLQILPRTTALQYVSAPLLEKRADKKEAEEKAKEMLSFFNIKKKLFNLSPLSFSGGEQQRVNIARGLIENKPLLLLDEPTASLDVKNKERVIKKIKQYKENGGTLIGIFHDEKLKKELSDRIFDVKNNRYL